MLEFLNDNDDLFASTLPFLSWKPTNREESLNIIYKYACSLANESTNWYVKAKRTKQWWARTIRVAAIVLGTLAAILPTLGELFSGNGSTAIRAGWTAVCLGIAGGLLLLDRFFGFSSAWMRYISAELELRQLSQEFQMNWQAEYVSWDEAQPSKDQANHMLAIAKIFISQVNAIVRNETANWIQEFQNTINYIDETIKAKPTINEFGTLNIEVTNGETVTDGIYLTINNASKERFTGKMINKRNLTAGSYSIKLEAIISGQNVKAEKTIRINAGKITDEKMTLQ